MTDDEFADFWEQHGRTVEAAQKEWADEFIRHPDGKEHLRELIEEADGDLASALATQLYDFFDAQGRRARLPRRKRGDHWRMLATYLLEKYPNESQLGLFKRVRLKDEEKDGIILHDGESAFEFQREEVDGKELITCKLPTGLPAQIEFDGFKRHLRKQKPGRRKAGVISR
jgi:hypothetical protein